MRIITIALFILYLGINTSASQYLKRQKRKWIIKTFNIEEEKPPPYDLGEVEVTNTQNNLRLKGQGVDEDPKNILKIHNNGMIHVLGKVDYEQYKTLNVTFEAYDSDNNIIDTRLGIEIIVSDINDNPPIFDSPIKEVTVMESHPQGTYVADVMASDKDNSQTKNGTFDFRIVSVSPEPIDLEFYIKKYPENGSIGFKGCLNHEKANKYTILVEAKDHGEVKQLSSTSTVIVNIEDGNNNIPVFIKQTVSGRVKENMDNVLVLRLQVTDADTRYTSAWRAEYIINGHEKQYFNIITDNITNEGLLYVQKPLNYETVSIWNFTVSVKNVASYQACKVKDRSGDGLWNVVTSEGEYGTGLVPALSTCHVTVHVEDVNDPPFFTDVVKNVVVEENTGVGHYLETFTAKDPDISYANTFLYVIGVDYDAWVTVNPKTGRVTTAKALDRESPFVKNNTYQVTLFAVDTGDPPMTGSATLNIYLLDQNDNAPKLNVSTIDMCISDALSMANISASDMDGDPFDGPFTFRLEGDVKGQWRIEPEKGMAYSASLVKESTVYAGHHQLAVEISDQQGKSAVHNLLVTVCNCVNTKSPNCRHRAITSVLSGGAIWIMLATLMLLLGTLLLAILISHKKVNKQITYHEEGCLKSFNTESPGTDCEVILPKQPPVTGRDQQGHLHRNGMHRVSQVEKKQHECIAMRNGEYTMQEEKHDLNLHNLVGQRISTLQKPGEELGHYDPKVYAEEGDQDTVFQLDAISIQDVLFDTDMLENLGPRFNTLASICMHDAKPF